MPSLSNDIEVPVPVPVPAPQDLVPGLELELGKASVLVRVVAAVGKVVSAALWGLSVEEQLALDIGALRRQRLPGLALRRWSPFRLAMMLRKPSRRS